MADVYPIFQLGWFPDYSDADNYLSSFFNTDNFLNNHFSNAEVRRAHRRPGDRAGPRGTRTRS